MITVNPPMAPLAGATFTGAISAPSVAASGASDLFDSGRYLGRLKTGGPPATGTYNTGDWCVSAHGTVWVCISGGTPGTWMSTPDVRDLVTTGQESMNRGFAFQSVAIGTGSLRLTFFTARKTETYTQLKTYCGSTAASATPTLCKMGMYRLESNGDVTRIAQTANDTSLWSVAGNEFTKQTEASFTLTSGIRYALATLQVTSGTPATLAGMSLTNTIIGSTSPVMCKLSTQSDLPSSITASGQTQTGVRVYGEALP